jgi:hypothetical protein
MANVIFKFGTSKQYEALTTKDINTLYWLTDVQSLYKGEVLYGTGREASENAAGLLSAADYKKLQELITSGTVANLTPVDASVLITDGAIGVQISKEEGNALSLKTDGLYAVAGAEIVIPEYTLEKQAESTLGSSATYKLKKIVGDEVSYVGDAIEINEEVMLKSGSLEIVTETDTPYAGAIVGDKYLDLQLNDADGTHIYVSVNGLVDTVKAGIGIKVVDNTVIANLSAVDNNALIIADDGGLFVEKCGFTAVENAQLNLIAASYVARDYEITDGLFVNTLVKYNNNEIRVMFAKDTAWTKQNVGAAGDSNMYYIGFKAYAPQNATGFKEDLAKTIGNDTLYSFDDEFAGIDAYGRKYSIVWLPVAVYDEDTAAWTYYGDNSTNNKFIGWYYSVEWYDANGNKIGADTIRINLSNESTHTNILPDYMCDYATVESVEALSESFVWAEM